MEPLPAMNHQELYEMAKVSMFQWNDNLRTGLTIIDGQHKQYFLRVNDVLKHADVAESRELLMKAIGFVRSYVVLHFDTEQDAMQFHGYPGFESHLEQHQHFSEQLEQLARTFAGEGFRPGLAMELYALLVDWFVNHIRTVDMVLGDFLKAAENAHRP